MASALRLSVALLGTSLCTAALLQLATPARPLAGYTLSGHSLGVDARGFRVFDSFGDAAGAAIGHPSFPGSTGAVLAIRKAHAEWGSEPRELHGHGDGLASNAVLGGAGANFDQLFLGVSPVLGDNASNMHHALSGGLCNGSVLSFTQVVPGVGWRITYCDDFELSVGPGLPLVGSFDLQAIATRDIGLALGLGVSSVVGATMSSSQVGDGTGARSLSADDRAGLMALYGAAAATKPSIQHVSGFGQPGALLTIEGVGFDPFDNEVWFTPADAGALPVVAGGVASTAGGTTLSLPVPANVASGDLIVKLPGSGGASLSNAWPFELGAQQDAVLALATGLGGGNGEVPQLTVVGDLTPGSVSGFDVDVQLAGPHLSGLLFLGTGAGHVPFKGGYFEPLPLLAQLSLLSDGDGRVHLETAFAPGAPSAVTVVAQAWFADASGPAGATGSNGLVLTLP